VRETVAVRFWTLEEVKTLFQQYSSTMDTKILQDIHFQTSG